MRHPASVLAASLGGVALLAVLEWGVLRPPAERQEPEEAGFAMEPAVATPPLTLAEAPSSPEAAQVLAAFAAAIGETVDSAFDPSEKAVVTLKHRHADGTLSLGARLLEREDGFIHLERSPNGGIRGQRISKTSREALLLESDPGSGRLVIRRVSVTDLLCADFDRGRLRPGLPPEAAEPGPGSSAEAEASVPLLSSRPGSSRIIYLNFAGETVAGTSWNTLYTGGNPIVAAPYADPASITDIWESISEDYAVFDVDVTTNRSRFENAAPGNRVMAIFTPTKGWYGNAGGIAYVDSFGSSTNPYVWIFNVTANGAAESGAHEIGHSLGLRHDGHSTTAYYAGHTHPSGVDWAPIMGTGYGRDITQFSKGEYPTATRTEDDLAIIAEDLPRIPDDHGSSADTATPVPGNNGVIDMRGIVSHALDGDWFRLVTGATGPLAVTASPHPRFRNLDVALQLYDENLAVVASAAPEGPFEASIQLTGLPRGTYYLRVSGSGLGTAANGYTPYGSIGRYSLTGTFTAVVPPVVPSGLGASDGTSPTKVALTWDPVPLVEGYRVYRGLLPDGSDAVLIADTGAPFHDDTTAVAGTVYHYFVSSHNSSGESALSAGDSGWRILLPPPATGGLSATSDWPHSIRVSWNPADRAEEYRIYRNSTNSFAGSVAVATVAETSWHDTTTAVDEAFYYFVEAANASGASAPAATPSPGVKPALPPGTPTGLTASDGSSPLHVQVTWPAVPGATGYRLYRNTLESVSGATQIANLGPGTTSRNDPNAIPGNRYWYFVKVIENGGQLSFPSNLDAGHRLLLAPSAPLSVTATLGTHLEGVRITWSVGTGAATYQVYRSTGPSPDNAEYLGETSEREWIDSTAAPGRTYHYFVQSSNAAGTSAFSAGALGSGAEPDPLDDVFENNDVISLAAELVRHEISASAINGDPDWYSLTLDSADTRLDLIVPFEGDAGSLLVSIFDAAGNPVRSATQATGAAVMSHQGAAGATYLVLVESDEGKTVPYGLIWRSPSEGEHGLEPDETIGVTFPPRTGEGIRNLSGAGQYLVHRFRGWSPRPIYLGLLNRSAVAGQFATRLTGLRRDTILSAFRLGSSGWEPVTAAVRRGGAISNLEPYQQTHFKLSLRMRRTGTRRRAPRSTLMVLSHVLNDPGTADNARWVLVPVGRR